MSRVVIDFEEELTEDDLDEIANVIQYELDLERGFDIKIRMEP